MVNYKEIVTKAIIGKCKKKTKASFKLECDEKPDTILGCWVINHSFSGTATGGKINLSGSYDVNVWYSYDNNTKTGVCTKRFSYSDMMNASLKNGATLDDKSEIIVECLKQPSVTDVKIENGYVNLQVEKELGVEIIGNATVKVAVEDDFDDYEELYDTDDEKELNINIDNIDDNYLDDAVNK